MCAIGLCLSFFKTALAIASGCSQHCKTERWRPCSLRKLQLLPICCQNQAGTGHVQAVDKSKVASGIVEDGVVASLEDVSAQFCLASVRMMRKHYMRQGSRHGAPLMSLSRS